MRTLYWPVAAGLRFGLHGGLIELDEDSANACKAVAELVFGGNHDAGMYKCDFVVTPSAGNAGDKWNGVSMSSLMQDYLLGLHVDGSHIVPLHGQTYNTKGEAMAIASYLATQPEIRRVVVCVKWWHAIRAQQWLYYCLERVGLSRSVTIVVKSYQSTPSNKQLFREFFLAIPYSILRMLWCWPRRIFTRG